MTTIDPKALLNAVQNSVAAYDGIAPAVLFEVDRNGLSAETARGVLSIDDTTPATTDAKFEIASQSKMMTATIAFQLASEGRFSLDDKLSDVIDVAPLEGIANIHDVTLRQLINHSSGIPDYLNDFDSAAGVPVLWEQLVGTPPQQVGFAEAIQFLIDRNAPAEFEPGARTEYSNTGYLLLQMAIEATTGNTLADELQTRIFDPVGMTSSSLPGFEPPEGIINSYVNTVNGLLDVTNLPLASSGDGGVVSTTQDMIRFMKALVVDETLVPADYMDDLAQFFAAVDILGEDFVGHDGGSTGTTSMTMVHLPTGTVFSAALSVAGDAQALGKMFGDVIVDVLTNDSWLGFEGGEGDLDFALTAAEIDVSEVSGDGGVIQTHIDMQGVTLALDRALGALDTDRLSFEDGSRLFIADEDGSRFSVRRDAGDAVRSDNQLIGRGADDRLTGGNGNDKILGNDGDDRLAGKRGDDLIAGGAGDDRLHGNKGADVLFGGAGDDVLRGGVGADRLDGGEGNDVLFGGRGADTFVFSGDAGHDTVLGFETGRDKIDLTALGITFGDHEVESHRGGSAHEITYEGGSLIVAGADAPLTADDFLF